MRASTGGTTDGTIRITFDGNHGAIDFSKLTFAQLRKLLPTTGEQDIPTFKALREARHNVLVQARTEDEATLTVFCNGFFSYETESGRVTVYGVDRCSRILFSSGDGQSSKMPDYGFQDEAFGDVDYEQAPVLSDEHFGKCLWAKVLELV